MAIDFPASPTNGQTYVFNGVTYTYDGTKWTAETGSVSLDKIEEGNTSAEVIDTGSDGRFVVTTEGTEALRVDSSGKVGIGTATPDTRLQLTNSNNNTTFSGAGVLNANRVYANGVFSAIQNTSATNGSFAGLQLAANNAATFSQSIGLLAVSNTSGTAPNFVITQRTDTDTMTERMRIGSDGTSYFQSPGNVIGAITTVGAGTSNRLYYGAHSGSGIGGTISYTVWTNGNVVNTNNSYGPLSSDERLKQDIVDASSQWDDIKAIRLAKFHYKNDPTGELQLGPIAQELEQVCPSLITRRPASEDEIADPSNSLVDGDEVLSFKASILYMKAVKALQEAQHRIETLEQITGALAARITALEAN